MTERVTTTWELEREHAERDYVKYETFTLTLDGVFSYERASRDQPGDCLLELNNVRWRGEPFELTAAEEAEIVEHWTEELCNE